MLALLTTPGEAGSAGAGEGPEPRAGRDEVLLRPLEVGVCGTDREIADGHFGAAPEGEERLVLGHELVAEVAADGHGFSRGELVAATVRRSCERCAACAAGAPDACLTGAYRERGITRLHGFASELVAERPEHLVRVPPALGRLGVLAEPGSVCARAIRHARAIGGRQPWSEERALVLGTGAIGVLTALFLRLDGFEVWAAARSAGGEKAALLEATDARYVSTDATPLPALAHESGGFDVVVEATGDAQVMLDTLALLRRNGVACLLGLDGEARAVSIDGRVLGVDTVVGNRALAGSVNAHRVDWDAAVAHLDRARRRWPEVVEALVGLRVPVDRFAEAFAFRGVKATLTFG
jgi:threonine dehydrogenase-like Zn-dependent dehydrogenase